MLAQLRDRKLLGGRDGCSVSSDGETFFAHFGIDVEALASSRRTLCRPCLDWSERRHHLGGALGAAILARIFALRWARRELNSRAILFSTSGERSLHQLFGARSAP
jgi:hypothetical protein